VKNYFNTMIVICFVDALQGSNMDSLIQKAKKCEKKYEWLQAADCYNRAMRLIDSHCHLYALHHISDAVAHAKEGGEAHDQSEPSTRLFRALANEH